MTRRVSCLALGLAFGLGLTPALARADCAPGWKPLFSCDFPEHNARVQLCRNGASGAVSYDYSADGRVELVFTDPTPRGGVKQRVRGITGGAAGMGFANGATVYAVFGAGALLWPSSDEGAQSPNPAVLQVYDSVAAFDAFEDDRPVQRRVCYPPSIALDSEWFGPG